MMIDVKLEKLSGHAKEGKMGKIHINVGDEVKEQDLLFEIETNKGNVAIKSVVSGEIKSIKAAQGDTVKIGDVLAKIEGEKEKKAEKTANGFNYFGTMLKPVKREFTADITIIGGGPGGYVAAIQAAKMGANVVLVEKENVGGTCLNWGCIPTKALVRSADVYKTYKQAEEYGLSVEHSSVDMKKVLMRKSSIVSQLVQGVEYLLKKNNVTFIKGTGEMLDSNTVYVKEAKGETTITTKNIILGTGSVSVQPPIPGMELKNVITSKEALDLEELPKHMVIIGGGVIGMEFAFIYAHFGVKVTIIEFLDTLLASFDEDVIEEITRAAKEIGIQIYTGSKVEEIIKSENEECIVRFSKDGNTKYLSTDKVLVAVGRKPYFEGVGIEKLGLELNENKKGVKVNAKMQTNIPNIYAIGDLTNKVQLAHVASHQGIVAVKNCMGKEMEMDYDIIPSAVFTDPEIATVGVSEKGAKQQEMDIEIGIFPFAASGKALTLGETRGFVKIIKEKQSGKLIGGTIIGPHATDLIAEIALGIKNELTAEQLIETIHAHPTTAEAVHEAVLEVEGGAIHFVK